MPKHITKILAYLRKHIVVVGILCGLVVTFGAGAAFAMAKTQSALELDYIREGQPVGEPFRISLGQVVSRVDGITISPKVDGDWHFHSDIFGINGLEFVPESSFSPDQEYTVKISNIVRHATGSADSIDLVFQTELAPGVLGFSPSGDGSTIAADQQFNIRLKAVGDTVKEVQIESDPSVEFERTGAESGYSWRPKDLLPQGEKLSISVLDAASRGVIFSRTFKVADTPSIKAISKKIDMLPGDVLEIEFSQPIDINSAPDTAIKFDMPGFGQWSEDGQKYLFTVGGDVAPGGSYGYVIDKDLRTKEGGILTEQLTGSLRSRGAVEVVGVSPGGSEVAQARQHIRITFNQPVDRASAQNSFNISAGQVAGFAWSDNTMVVTVVDLGYQNQVRVSLSGGIRPDGFGLNSGPWGYTFHTEARVVKLSVPYYKQVYAQSCEAASVRMALAYRGVHTSDWDVLQRFGYNPTHKNQETNTWEDPQKQFVGDVNGNQSEGTGWGVFAEPVAAAVRSYGRQASTHYGVSAQLLAQQLYNDRPVVLWGIWGSSARIQTWTTADGGTASGPFPMHVRLVVGVKGSVENPLGFYVHDPITGSAYWSTAQLMSNTQKAGPANQAVVIY